MLYGCGLRVSELVNLKLSNIYEEEQCLQIFGKGDKERWVSIQKSLFVTPKGHFVSPKVSFCRSKGCWEPKLEISKLRA